MVIGQGLDMQPLAHFIRTETLPQDATQGIFLLSFSREALLPGIDL
jgi:hypothetical protein